MKRYTTTSTLIVFIKPITLKNIRRETLTTTTTKSTTKSTTIIIIYLPSDNGSIPINDIVSGAINNFLLE
jgi:hypothetical protein